MECENCGRGVIVTVVVTDGHETVPLHLCRECARVAGLAAAMCGAEVVGVYRPGCEAGLHGPVNGGSQGEEQEGAARPSPRPTR